MKMSAHAWVRWAERFPDRSPYREFAQAFRPSKRLLRLLNESNYAPRRRIKGKMPGCDRRSYMISPSGVVFVVADDDVVITAFSMDSVRHRIKQLQLQREG
jgi:hypothetical protein